MEAVMPSRAAQILSTRGFQAQSDRSWTKMFDILTNPYDEKTNPNGYLSLGVAENRLMHKELAEYINSHFSISAHMLTYADGGFGSKKLRGTFAQFLTKHLKARRPIEFDEVIAFPGCTTAIESIATMIANPGDGVLLAQPYYSAFSLMTGMRAGVRTVPVSFGEVDPFSMEGIAKYEEALLDSEKSGVKIRGIIFCNPHNPLGRCFPVDVTIELLKFCQKHQIHFISDEAYALSVWENNDRPDAVKFTSVLELDLTGVIDSDLVHVVWGVSKDFGANGLRIGCAIVQNEPMRTSMIAHSNLTFCSGPSDVIVVSALSDSNFVDKYLEENRVRLAYAYERVTAFLKVKKIPYYQHHNAAIFVWVDLRRPYLANRQLSSDVTKEEGDKIDNEINGKLLANRVFLSKGSGFGDEAGGWFRIVFSHPDSYLDVGLERMWQAIKGDAQ